MSCTIQSPQAAAEIQLSLNDNKGSPIEESEHADPILLPQNETVKFQAEHQHLPSQDQQSQSLLAEPPPPHIEQLQQIQQVQHHVTSHSNGALSHADPTQSPKLASPSVPQFETALHFDPSQNSSEQPLAAVAPSLSAGGPPPTPPLSPVIQGQPQQPPAVAPSSPAVPGQSPGHVPLQSSPVSEFAQSPAQHTNQHLETDPHFGMADVSASEVPHPNIKSPEAIQGHENDFGQEVTSPLQLVTQAPTFNPVDYRSPHHSPALVHNQPPGLWPVDNFERGPSPLSSPLQASEKNFPPDKPVKSPSQEHGGDPQFVSSEILSATPASQSTFAVPETTHIQNSTPASLDWMAIAQAAETKASALARVLESAQRTAAAKQKQLNLDLMKRNQRIREIEGKNTELQTAVRNLETKLESLASSKDSSPAVTSSSSSHTKELEAKVAHLTKENRQLRQKLKSGGEGTSSQNDSTRAIAAQNTKLYEEAKVCITTLRRHLEDKEREILAWKEKVDHYQALVNTNVDGIAEMDAKLQQSHKALRWLLKSYNGNLATNPHAYAPQYSPQYISKGQPKIGGSSSPNFGGDSHMSPTTAENFQSLQELEELMTARYATRKGLREKYY